MCIRDRYETKDIGLLIEKWQDYHFNRSIVITANEQAQYMAVVLKAIEQFAPELAKASQHITHGSIRLQGNVKMGSRLGNIIRATEVLDSVNAVSYTHLDVYKRQSGTGRGKIRSSGFPSYYRRHSTSIAGHNYSC